MKAPHKHFSFFRPVRLRRFLTIAVMVLILSLSVGIPLSADVGQQPIQLPDLADVQCSSFVVFDRNTKQIIVSQDPDKEIYPASMTKIMTAILALEYLDTNQIVTVSQTAIDATTPNSSLMGLKVGEEISVSELLYGLLLPSGNDAANVLAEAVVAVIGPVNAPTTLPTQTPTTTAGGSQTGETTAVSQPTLLDLFANVMNQKAAELGLTHTHFMNANGLHDANHYTTASELAKIFDCALGYAEFRTVISSPTHVFKATNLHDFDAWSIAKNTNQLLTDPWILGADTKVAEVVGGKTGTTINAGTGMTLLTIDKNGDELITVVCGIPYEDANHLTSYLATIVNAGAEACFSNDPVVRVTGNVMDNKPENVSEGFFAAVPTSAVTPVLTQTPTPTSSNETTSTATDASGSTSDHSKSADKSGIIGFITSHPLISIALGLFVIIVLFLVFTYVAVNRKRKHRRNGIRRI